MSLIEIDNISYSIGGKKLISDLSFCIEEKSIVSLIGYNGSGKSTLLKLLLGVVRPDSGLIKKRSGLLLGYVPQKLGFSHQFPITVRDFISIYNAQKQRENPFSCSFLDIESLFDTPLSGLSGGQLQRVLIYNALLGKPDILLLDEPTAGLDVLAQKEFYSLIEHIHQEHGLSLVLVSHDLHSVYSRSDSVICLHQGRCCRGAPGDQLFSQEVNNLLGGYVMPYLHKHRDDR